MSAVFEEDIGVSRDEAVNASRDNLNFFAALCVPEIFLFVFPAEFIAIWQMLVNAVCREVGKERIAIGLPRGFGKTLLLKLFVAWCIAFTDRKFILVVCNTASLAENFISDVADILSSINFIRVFGDWRYTLEKDTQELKKFRFKNRDVILVGLGAGSSLRGLNLKFVRPDIIIQDDMQNREEASSPTESKKNLEWMLGTLMMANDNRRCVHIFVGNMYPYEGSILRKLQQDPSWVSFITGAILEDGRSLWPQLRTIEDILAELESLESLGHPEIFYAEVMNDAVAGSRSGVDFTKINVWQDSDAYPLPPEAGFVIIDPSLNKKTSDDTAIGVCLIYDGVPMLREVLTGKFNEGEKIMHMIRLAAKYGLTALVIEAVAYQGTLSYWVEQKKLQLGLPQIRVLTITPEGEQKNARILKMLLQLTSKDDKIWLHKEARSQVLHQIMYFDPLKTKNKDDILDIMAYFYKVIKNHGNLLLKPLEMFEEQIKAAFTEDLLLQLDF